MMSRIDKVPTLLIDVLLATDKIFCGKNLKDWECYECEDGMIRFHGQFCYGPAGIEGTLGIGIPPSAPREHDGDAWEGSHNSLAWDWWSCLGFLTVPSPEHGPQIIVFFAPNTFFDRPLEVIKTITLNHNDQLYNSNFAYYLTTSFWAFSDADEFDDDNSNAFKQLLELEFDANFIRFEYIN